MSYWVYLEDDKGETLHTDTAIEEGGTYMQGGSTACELNITYNYGTIYAAHEFSIRHLHEQIAGDTIPRLESLVEQIGTVTSHDYWEATPGNAGHAVSILLRSARQHPTGAWRVS